MSKFKQPILPILLLLLIASCGLQHQEKKFVLFHDRHDDIAVKYCAKWYPVHDSIHEQVFYQPGDTIQLLGDIIEGNCDSVYLAALDEASKNGGKLVIPKIRIQTLTKLIHDTFRVRYDNYINDTKQSSALNIKYNDQSERLAVSKSKLKSSRIFGAVGWCLFLICILAVFIRERLKLKI
jgi:hypothetical protein